MVAKRTDVAKIVADLPLGRAVDVEAVEVPTGAATKARGGQPCFRIFVTFE